MMYLKSLSKVFILAAAFLATHVHANLMLETYASGTATPTTVGGYAMTDFAFDNILSGSTSTVSSPIDGVLGFEDINGSALNMNRSTADANDWWVNGESGDYDIFTTDVHWVRILLPANTRAFSFNVGASFSGRGWVEGYEGDNLSLDRSYFGVNPTNTPGFGVYADNSNGQCGAISSVIVEPAQWGIGNLSIHQSDCTTEVPEPSPIGLLGLGLIGLGVLRYRMA